MLIFTINPNINFKLQEVSTQIEVACYHCGDPCKNKDIAIGDKYFCCNGCKLVYEILEQGNLCYYYAIDEKPGISQNKNRNLLSSRYEFLDDEQIAAKLIDFTDGNITTVTFFIPQMHCSACIWLLENLYKLKPGVKFSEVNFLQKKLSVKFKQSEITLRQLVELLVSIGYEPQINLGNLEQKIKYSSNRKLYYKIGVAGFCFGNIMLLSFPEYLSLGGYLESLYRQFFGALNILLAIPVFFYSASDYFKSAYAGLRQKSINIDFPIALGIIVLFARSVYEIATQTGAGFIDSMTGLIFLLLAGKLFQSKTYDALNFERNYKSYFPISVTLTKAGKESTVSVSKLKQGDRIVVRNDELIPADAILFSGNGHIDYSFVTGESVPVEKVPGEIIYAGGRQKGSAVELEVIRTVSQSYLTQLWNKDTFVKEDENRFVSVINIAAKYFTAAILLISLGAALYWLPVSVSKAINAFTAVLIIACPCGLALTNPFALGNAMRILGKNKLYLKNTSVAEKMSNISSIVFDKTGTITEPGDTAVTFSGSVLTPYEQKLVKSLVRNSLHPLSSKIYSLIAGDEFFEVNDYNESLSKGIEGKADGCYIRIGSAEFAGGLNFKNENSGTKLNTRVYLSINNSVKGYFSIKNIYRHSLESITSKLEKAYELSVLSGDNEGERESLLKFFDNKTKLNFNQSPEKKLEYIKLLQDENKKVLMLGDGLNDAGALNQSNVGIAVTEDITGFSPACDAILDASAFKKIYDFIKFTKSTKRIILASFTVSFLYNIAGITLAFQGAVSPLLAAVLMPASSVSVVFFTVISTNIAAKRKNLL
jgi:Cu+-exporting ATPase